MFIKLSNCIEYNDVHQLSQEEFTKNEYYIDSDDIWKFRVTSEVYHGYSTADKADKTLHCEVLAIYSRVEPKDYDKYYFLDKREINEAVAQIVASKLEPKIVETFG